MTFITHAISVPLLNGVPTPTSHPLDHTQRKGTVGCFILMKGTWSQVMSFRYVNSNDYQVYQRQGLFQSPALCGKLELLSEVSRSGAKTFN